MRENLVDWMSAKRSATVAEASIPTTSTRGFITSFTCVVSMSSTPSIISTS